MICPHFEEGCGGCTWQHIAYPEQLRLKTALVDELVRAAVPRAPAARPTLPSTPLDEPWGYRHKVHFVFGADRGRLVMGHYIRGSRRVLPVQQCPVHDPRGNQLAFSFGDAFAKLPGNPRRGLSRSAQTLRAIAIRAAANTTEMAATLVVSTDSDRAVRTATKKAIAAAIEPPTSFHVNIHPADDGFIFGRETRHISGPPRMREAVAGVSFVVSPTAFFQTNVHAAEILVRLVLEAIPDGARVLDLYAGAGLFSLTLAGRGHTVTAA
jgi:23S rRNA (uracil1939-C5)-methyltransferase